MAKNEPNYIWRDRKRTFLGLPWSFTVYYLTETKLIRRRGFFNIEEDEIDLYKIGDKKLLLPFAQRLIGCGTIQLLSRDIDNPKTEIRSIKKPREVMELLDKYINQERDRYGTRGRDLYGVGVVPNPQENSDQDDNDFI
jgi:hypothetical protein